MCRYSMHALDSAQRVSQRPAIRQHNTLFRFAHKVRDVVSDESRRQQQTTQRTTRVRGVLLGGRQEGWPTAGGFQLGEAIGVDAFEVFEEEVARVEGWGKERTMRQRNCEIL